MKTESKKPSVPWKTVKPSYSPGSEGSLVKLENEWYVLCLRIGSPKDGRWYARKEDGSQWRISMRRVTEVVYSHDWNRDDMWNDKTNRRIKAPFQAERKVWLDIMNAGTDRAHEIRDRISTRRMNTSMRRGLYGGGLY